MPAEPERPPLPGRIDPGPRARARGAALAEDPLPQGGGAFPFSADFVEELDGARRRVRVLEEASRAVQDLLHRVARLATFAEGLEERGTIEAVADLLFDELREIVPVGTMVLALADANGPPLTLARVSPPAAAEDARREVEAQTASGVLEWAMGLRRPIVVPAACLEGNLVLLPLAAAGRGVGVLVAATTLAAGAVEQEHLTLGGVVARQAAECIENLRLADSLRCQNEQTRRAGEEAVGRRVADLGLLVEAARTVCGSLDRTAALDHLLGLTCRHLGVTRVAISLREPDGRLPVAASVGLPADDVDAADHEGGDGGLIACVVERGEPVVVSDVSTDTSAPRGALVRGAGAAAFLGVPLVARGQVIGALSVLANAPRAFVPEEVALLTGLGAQGALAIENARLFEDLQTRMAERERTLGRLVQSARMASVGLLAGGIAHDINNPLCIISNHLQILALRRGHLPPEVVSTLDIIEANVNRIAASIQGLSAYAAGRPGERHPTDIVEATQRVLGFLHGHSLYRSLRVATTFASDLPAVELDRASWEQLVLELLTNAREAMPQGGTVRVTLWRLDGVPGSAPADGDWIEMMVEDDGPGIPAEDLPRIFDPFFTTKGPKSGLGLGLRMCRDIVRDHGGRLRVESDGGAGTRVVVELPPAVQVPGAAPSGQTEGEGAVRPVDGAIEDGARAGQTRRGGVG